MVKSTIGKNKAAAAMQRRLDRAIAKQSRAAKRAAQPKQRWY
jgi:hypothetical protein